MLTRYTPHCLLMLIVCTFLVACGGGGGGSGSGSGTGNASNVSNGPSALTLNLAFTRKTAPADGSFIAEAWLTDANSSTIAFGAAPNFSSSRGIVSAPISRPDKKYEITMTPDTTSTGEYTVTVSTTLNGTLYSQTKTALVLGEVASGWGQATMVDGLVNTAGTQDSLTISPDGQYLFLQYYPVTLSCILSGNPNSAYCTTPLGPVSAPWRPNMPGADRVTTTVTHGCPSIGFNPSPVPVPPIALYGFRRQTDGRYAEPFVFRFNGGDGCFSPWGPTVKSNGDGTYRMVMAFNDPRNSGSPQDFAHLYSLDFTPGSTINLGDVSFTGTVQINNFSLQALTISGTDTHRGNPHVYYNGNTPSLLFYDEETKTAANQYIQVSTWNGSSWNSPIALNFSNFNANSNGNTQPWFDGAQLFLREGLRLLRYGYSGGGVNNASSWSGPTVLLGPGTNNLTGSVIVVGEPSVATVAGHTTLFFVYGIKQADGSVNIRVGQIQQ